MAEEFEAGVCDESWWMSPRTACRTDFGGCWPRDYNLVAMKSKSSDDSSDGSMVLATTTDSAFQTTGWDQNLLLEVQEEMNTFTTGGDDDDQGQPLNFTTTTPYHHYPSTFSSPPLPLPPPPLCDSDNFNLVQDLPFWPSPFPSTSSYKDEQNVPNLTTKPNRQGIQGSGELPLKRPRLETPSPLPTFKVRKEKLGDRITALQQLVSPFGKTDTASVLHEAIDYIKLLHDQVHILSAPYMKNAAATKRPQQIHDKVKDMEDLRSLGLCLVPVSSTFPMATDMASGFWTPNHEGQFR